MNALKSRAEAIGLTLGALIEETGVSRATVSRWLNGHGSATLRTLNEVGGKIEAALIAHELAQRDYLIGLHGLPENPPAEERAA